MRPITQWVVIFAGNWFRATAYGGPWIHVITIICPPDITGCITTIGDLMAIANPMMTGSSTTNSDNVSGS